MALTRAFSAGKAFNVYEHVCSSSKRVRNVSNEQSGRIATAGFSRGQCALRDIRAARAGLYTCTCCTYSHNTHYGTCTIRSMSRVPARTTASVSYCVHTTRQIEKGEGGECPPPRSPRARTSPRRPIFMHSVQIDTLTNCTTRPHRPRKMQEMFEKYALYNLSNVSAALCWHSAPAGVVEGGNVYKRDADKNAGVDKPYTLCYTSRTLEVRAGGLFDNVNGGTMTDAKRPLTHYIAITANFWGRAKSVDQAVRNMRSAGGSTAAERVGYKVYHVAEQAGVDCIDGRITWPGDCEAAVLVLDKTKKAKMARSQCSKCGGDFFETTKGARGTDLCDKCLGS